MKSNGAPGNSDQASAQHGFGLSFWLITAVLGLSFFALENEWHFQVLDDPDATIEVYVGGANLLRRFGFFVIGGLGLLLLARRGQRVRAGGLLPWLVLAAVAWCAVSALWSDAPAQTARRLSGMMLALVGAMGAAKHLTARQLCLFAAVVMAMFGVVALASEISTGAFRPLSSDYRLAGTAHPNTIGLYMSLLCLAAACFVADGKWGRLLPGAALAMGLGLLLLTRSRTALLAAVASLAAVCLIRMSGWARVVAVMAAAWMLSSALFLLQFEDSSTSERLSQVVLLGRGEGAGDLTGRIPLWSALSRFVMERPWTGYGYQGFWTRHRYEVLAEDLEWTMPNAHNMYIEVALGMGLVGAGLLVLVTLVAAWRLGQRLRRGWELGTVFLFALLVLGYVHGLGESSLFTPMFMAFVGTAGVLRMAFFDEAQGNGL